METELSKDINAEIDAILAGMDLDDERFAKATPAPPEETAATEPPPAEDEIVEDETVEEEDDATKTTPETAASDEPPKRWCELTDEEKIERKRAYAREYMKRRREAAKAGLPQTVKENPDLRPNIARGETPRRATSVAALQRKCWELLLNGDGDGAVAIAKKWREETGN